MELRPEDWLRVRVAAERDRVPAARRRSGADHPRAARGRARRRARRAGGVLAREPRGARAAGLSANKLAAIIDLAAKFVDGTVPTHDLDDLSDDEIVARLVTVRGVGRWTAEMFLLFQLRRPDVWPVDDLGVRNGWARIHDTAAPPTPKALVLLGDVLPSLPEHCGLVLLARGRAPPPVGAARATRGEAHPVKAVGRRPPSRPKKA